MIVYGWMDGWTDDGEALKVLPLSSSSPRRRMALKKKRD